jgi:hypothetical protein
MFDDGATFKIANGFSLRRTSGERIRSSGVFSVRPAGGGAKDKIEIEKK